MYGWIVRKRNTRRSWRDKVISLKCLKKWSARRRKFTVPKSKKIKGGKGEKGLKKRISEEKERRGRGEERGAGNDNDNGKERRSHGRRTGGQGATKGGWEMVKKSPTRASPDTRGWMVRAMEQ
jgi:hypothetical protein